MLNTQVIALIVSALAAFSGIILGCQGKSRSVRQDTVADASKDAMLRADTDYIKRGVDDLRVEIRLQGQKSDALAERITRVEESAKQAHHRLDRIDKEWG
jgi:hypothetical protein